MRRNGGSGGGDGGGGPSEFNGGDHGGSSSVSHRISTHPSIYPYMMFWQPDGCGQQGGRSCN